MTIDVLNQPVSKLRPVWQSQAAGAPSGDKIKQARNNALVTMAAAHFGQAQAVRLDEPNTGFTRTVRELPHPGVAARYIEKDL